MHDLIVNDSSMHKANQQHLLIITKYDIIYNTYMDLFVKKCIIFEGEENVVLKSILSCKFCLS